MKIDHIVSRQILDSRGNPTVEADVWLENGVFGRAAVPSGASTGKHEAHELRDGGQAYSGLGVMQAVQNITDTVQPAIKGHAADDQFALDALLCDLDGTENKSNLGANAILAVSLAAAHAAAKTRNVFLYTHINDIAGNPAQNVPMPMINVLNGGKHATQSTDMQESMIIPVGATTYAQAMQIGAEVFAALKKILAERGLSTAVGDEGGFTLPVQSGNAEALEVLSDAVGRAGYTLGKDVVFALDVAASELFEDDTYHLKAEKHTLTTEQMIDWYIKLCKRFPVVSIEDGLAEDAWSGWQKLTKALPMQLVGDDLLVTNIERLQKGIDQKAANAILIKPNQIGTLTETIRAIQLAQKHNWHTVISHRSGETEDVTIAHIAVGTGSGQIKTGSMSRSERTAKHNELLRIESFDPNLKLVNPFTA